MDERELTAPVDLCTPDGRLAPEAVGWSRQPVHRCALPGSWGRRKRWDFWGITAPGLQLNVTVADADYVGIVDVWCRALASGHGFARAAAVPLARGVALPDRVGAAPIHAATRGLEVTLAETADGTRIAAHGRTAGGTFAVDVVVERPAGHESLSVVIPWSARRFQCTTKDVARPARGTVRWDGETWTLAADGTAWGCLDFGRGKWPYRMRWNWGAAAGLVRAPDGRLRRVGLQLGGQWTDGTGMTENALVVDGRLSKLSEDLVWTYDRRDWLRPWTVRTPGTDRVALTFTPTYDRVSRLGLGVLSQAVDQCFGTWSGTIVPDDGQALVVDALAGWAEEATWRW